jgi:hypothetical protein
MGHYPWPGKILYLGDFVKAKNLPWHYVPVWIALSTPFIYLLLFAVGLGGFLTGLVKKCEGFYKKQRDDIIFALWFFAPLSAVVILKSTLYNGWRQMFFIYPALLIFSVAGLSFLLKFVRMRSPALGQSIAAGFLVIFIATVVASMIKMHPYQNVYFNFLAGKSETVEKSFERDYWGLSYRKGLEYILSRDSSRLIKICADDAGQNNAGILPVKERSRLVFTEKPEGTDYFLGNFRGQKGGYHYGKEYYSIKAGNIEILAVYLMRLRRVQARSAPGEAVVKLIPPQRGGM